MVVSTMLDRNPEATFDQAVNMDRVGRQGHRTPGLPQRNSHCFDFLILTEKLIAY